MASGNLTPCSHVLQEVNKVADGIKGTQPQHTGGVHTFLLQVFFSGVETGIITMRDEHK